MQTTNTSPFPPLFISCQLNLWKWIALAIGNHNKLFSAYSFICQSWSVLVNWFPYYDFTTAACFPVVFLLLKRRSENSLPATYTTHMNKTKNQKQTRNQIRQIKKEELTNIKFTSFQLRQIKKEENNNSSSALSLSLVPSSFCSFTRDIDFEGSVSQFLDC